jgi:hypothetical protein
MGIGASGANRAASAHADSAVVCPLTGPLAGQRLVAEQPKSCRVHASEWSAGQCTGGAGLMTSR